MKKQLIKLILKIPSKEYTCSLADGSLSTRLVENTLNNYIIISCIAFVVSEIQLSYFFPTKLVHQIQESRLRKKVYENREQNKDMRGHYEYTVRVRSNAI